MDNRALLSAATEGDQAAWDALVQRYTGLLWSIARGFRLSTTDAADTVQLTWLKFVEHLGTIADPERLPAWLATTMRRECLQLIRRRVREPKLDDWSVTEVVDPAPPVEHKLLEAERDRALLHALATLSERCQRLLRVLMASPPPAYSEVSSALDIPVGSIGPTRQRCLGRLREVVIADGLLSSGHSAGGRHD
jgi:RNA polymerase sigma factor (sigma-70 family)